MKRIPIYLVFIALVLGGGLLIGLTNLPGPWYQSLNKPPFTPPNWVFGPAWTTLYVLIGIAGARTFTSPQRQPGLGIWVVQMALNFLWSPLFFGLEQPKPALAVILALFAAIIAFIAERWRRDRIAALLFLPYAAWVAFAGLLNGWIAIFN